MSQITGKYFGVQNPPPLKSYFHTKLLKLRIEAVHVACLTGLLSCLHNAPQKFTITTDSFKGYPRVPGLIFLITEGHDMMPI